MASLGAARGEQGVAYASQVLASMGSSPAGRAILLYLQEKLAPADIGKGHVADSTGIPSLQPQPTGRGATSEKGSRKRKGKAVDEDRVKKKQAPHGYMLFSQEMWALYNKREAPPELAAVGNPQEGAAVIGRLWRELPLAKKAEYKLQAQEKARTDG